MNNIRKIELINNFDKNEKKIKFAVKNLENAIYHLTSCNYNHKEFSESLIILYAFLKRQYDDNKKFNDEIPSMMEDIEIDINKIKKILKISKDAVEDKIY